MTRLAAVAAVLMVAMISCPACAQAPPEPPANRAAGGAWRTDFSKHSADLAEFEKGGPPKDGIPAVDAPKFIRVRDAAAWIGRREPVIAVEIGGVARAYPPQILVWHEIVNDTVAGIPVAVTFCPLCYSAIVFDRRVGDRVLSFGVTGLLRNSDLVMYDRQTESWWQQVTGEAVVGSYTETRLAPLPAQIVGFGQFAAAFPEGEVLSRDTGYRRDYGRNPYAGYDDVDRNPFL